MIETKFTLNTTTVNVVKIDTDSLVSKLPNKVYTVRYNENTGKYYLGLVQEDYKENLPKRMYGINGRQDKVIKTFKTRDKSTGLLLSGDSGVGKTQLMIGIAEELRKEGTPVILVESKFYGEDFNEFISSLGVCVVLFDEFGKIYGDQQENLLSLLDGTTSSKKLYIFTENNSRTINDYILDRPGRAFYHFKYTKLALEVVNEYLTEVEITDNNKKDLLDYYSKVDKFSFDTLQAVVTQCNRFPEDTMATVLEELNVPVVPTTRSVYKVMKLVKDGKDITQKVTSSYQGRSYFELSLKKGKDKHYNIAFHVKKELVDGSVMYKTEDAGSTYEITVLEEQVAIWGY